MLHRLSPAGTLVIDAVNDGLSYDIPWGRLGSVALRSIFHAAGPSGAAPVFVTLQDRTVLQRDLRISLTGIPRPIAIVKQG